MTTTLETPVLIIGGGVAGLAAGVELSRRELGSVLAERSPRLGGQAARFCCKATESCARCGACLLGDVLAQAAASPRVRLFTRALPVAAERKDGLWRVELSPQEGQEDDPAARTLEERAEVSCPAVIVAAGATPFNAQRKSRFGYGRVPGVITGLELERMLARGERPEAGRVAFIQCVGSRDESIGAMYCSRVCCGYALRMARLLKRSAPETEITFYHMDVQDYGRAWEGELAELRGQIDFVRAMPGEVRPGQGGPQVVHGLPEGGRQSREYDLVVLSVGMSPPLSAGPLAEMFGLGLDPDGFLQDADAATGVFVAGAARGPRSIAESLEHAALAASRAHAWLANPGQEAAHA